MHTLTALFAALLTVSSLPQANASSDVLTLPEPGAGRAAAVAADGTRYLAGAISSQRGKEGQLEPLLFAVDLRGEVRWRLRWDGPGQIISVTSTLGGPVALIRAPRGQLDADPGPLTHPITLTEEWSFFAVALSSDGQLRWTWTAPGAELAAAVTLPDDSVAITGTSRGSAAGFVAAVDAHGATRWQRPLPGDSTMPYALAASSPGIFVTGIGHVGAPQKRFVTGAFVARLTLDGEVAWLRRFGARGATAKGYAIAADEDRVVVGGLFRGALDFDPGPRRDVRRSVDSDDDGYVSVFDMAGALQYVYSYGARSSDQIRGVAIELGHVHALGSQTEVVDLGGAAGLQDPATKWFLLALDANGAARAATPIARGAAQSYPGLYVGSMSSSAGRFFISGDVSSQLTIFDRVLAPLGGGANARRPVWIDLAL